MFKTASVILVSEFFLRGTQDDVLKKLLTQLSHLNYLVKKVSVLHENEKIITNEINTLSKQFDIVIVVSQLCDIIFKALANVTFQNLTENLKFKEILETLQASNNYQLPVAAKLLLENDSVYPIIQLQTIFVLNGKYIENHLNMLRKCLAQYKLESKYKKIVHIQKNGNAFEILDKIKNLPVTITCHRSDTIISVTLETTSFEDIVEVEKAIKHEFSDNFINSCIINSVLQNIYTDSNDRIQQALEVSRR